MSWMENFLGSLDPSRGYTRAGEAIQGGWDEAKGYMSPYNNAGQSQIPGLQGAFANLLNPEKLQSEWASHYETSPQAKDLMERARNEGMDDASAMGLSGSSAALENTQRTGSSIMRADRQQYLNDLMDKYKTGISGGLNMFGTGANMGANMGRGAMETGQNLGQTRFGESSAFQDMLVRGLGAYFGGGGGLKNIGTSLWNGRGA